MIPACMNQSNGKLQVYTGAIAGNRWLQGFRMVSIGDAERVYAAVDGVPAYWIAGVPVTRDGAICLQDNVAVGGRISQALSKLANGLLAATDTLEPNRHANGMGFNAELLCCEQEAVLLPPGPFNLSGDASTVGIIYILWTASSNADRYDILKNGEFFKTASAGATSTFDTAIVSGVDYTYAVRARNGDGTTLSTPVNITLTAA